MTKAERQERRSLWATRIADYRASGQSQAAWCAQHGLKIHQFRYWLKKQSQTAEDTPTRWLSLDLANAPVVIRVGQVTVEVQPGFDPDLLRDVVRTLAQ